MGLEEEGEDFFLQDPNPLCDAAPQPLRAVSKVVVLVCDSLKVVHSKKHHNGRSVPHNAQLNSRFRAAQSEESTNYLTSIFREYLLN